MSGPGDSRRAGATFDRSVVLSQLLFGAVLVTAVFTLLLFSPSALTKPIAIVAVAIVFTATGVAIILPWHRFPRAFVMALPIVDILAIGLIRIAEPAAGVGLLWFFPTIWLASYFGLTGAIIAVSSSSVLVWISEIVSERAFTPISVPSVVLLPIALSFIATSTVLSSRRAGAQRVLLRTQAKQLERALRRANKQEERLAEVLNAVDFGVVRLDRDGRGGVMNTAYARLYGLDVADPDAARDGVAFAADRATPLSRAELPFNRAAAGQEFDDEVTWIPAEGSELRAVSVTARRLYDEDGGLEGSVLVARDITEERNAVRARDDLVASVSHELRTPMTSVLGYIDLSLDAEGLPPNVVRNLEIMQRNGDRMLELIASILQSAKHAEAPVPLALAPVDLHEILRDAVEAAQARADERDIRLTITTSEAAVVRADGFRLRQVVDNLVSNAVKYNRQGGEVMVGATVDEGMAWVVVRDTGIGIPEAELPKVFERFFRSGGVRQGTVHGSGLGLGIARELVERHGGEIHIDSEEGSGTTVIVTLPVAGPEDA
ncbi:sensor histidine kinase [Agromyces soli]|uniref:histidine kinase n=1 Tax=Agromyces soli TaxID=659012 RepID=A0ABY4ASG0_9MICO|nr:PAS domain-containing sensor histidine kinase [Agromyces soli]UOE24798.1 PAS domain-containing sensor histidine kinase [Agromyces soli]